MSLLFGCCRSSSVETDAAQKRAQQRKQLTNSLRSSSLSLSQSFVFYDSNQDGGVIACGEKESQFFDARMDEFSESYEAADKDCPYLHITCNHVKKTPRSMSILQPESLLEYKNDYTVEHQDTMGEEQVVVAVSGKETGTGSDGTGKKFSRAKSLLRRGSVARRKELAKPREYKERGFPGQLTEDELAQCLHFVRELREMDPACAEIVYAFSDLEEEPYALCRFMRAVKFNADVMLQQRLPGYCEDWNKAKAHNFYKDIDHELGIPVSVFLTQCPNGYIGCARNGCPVKYFKAGKIQMEGVLSLISVPQSEAFYWNQFVHQYTERVVEARKINPDFARLESINVVDLKGLSSAQMTSDVMEVLKIAGKVGDCFPESLHSMLVINAPSWFSVTWRVIRNLIDPRTVQKIEVFSNVRAGQQRLHDLVDDAYIPSDYGGTGPPMMTAIQGGAPVETKLVSVRRNAEARHAFVVPEGIASAKLYVYTRSSTRARVSLEEGSHGGKEVTVEVSPPNERVRLELGVIQSPGSLEVVVKDLGDVRQSGMPTGFYLLTMEPC